MTIIIKNKETLTFDDFTFKCCIGKNGTTNNKFEGDNKTPKGLFSIDKVYYRKDKNIKPITKLNTISINRKMGWCNDVTNKKYNRLIKINKNINMKKSLEKTINTITSYL